MPIILRNNYHRKIRNRQFGPSSPVFLTPATGKVFFQSSEVGWFFVAFVAVE